MKRDRYFKQSTFISAYVAALQDKFGDLGLGDPEAAGQLQMMLNVLPKVPEVKFHEDINERLPYTKEGFLTRRKQLDKTVREVSDESGVDYNAVLRIEKGQQVYSDSLLGLMRYYESKGL